MKTAISLPDDLFASVDALARKLLCAGCVLIACRGPAAPPFLAEAAPLDPLPPYRLWWALTQECSALSGDFDRVRWLVVHNASSFPLGDEGIQGYWASAQNAIVLAETSLLDGHLVRHEMLHALLARGGHQPSYFRDRCGGVVSCGSQACRSETGADIPPVVPETELAHSDLSAELTVRPDSMARDDNGGWVALMVKVRNPRSAAVKLRLEPIGAGAAGSTTFGYTLGGSTSAELVSLDSVVVFAPNQERRYLFDLPNKTLLGYLFPAGTYRVRGVFNGDSTPPGQLVLRP